jgi:hypothetical protein
VGHSVGELGHSGRAVGDETRRDGARSSAVGDVGGAIGHEGRSVSTRSRAMGDEGQGIGEESGSICCEPHPIHRKSTAIAGLFQRHPEIYGDLGSEVVFY